MASIGYIGYTSARQAARDGKRKSELKSFANTIEQYYNLNQRYPIVKTQCTGSLVDPAVTNIYAFSWSIGNPAPRGRGICAIVQNGSKVTGDWNNDTATDTLKMQLKDIVNALPDDPANYWIAGARKDDFNKILVYQYATCTGNEPTYCKAPGSGYSLEANLERAIDQDANRKACTDGYTNYWAAGAIRFASLNDPATCTTQVNNDTI